MKEVWHTYSIKFTKPPHEEHQVENFRATSPGQAFSKCLRANPGCKLVEGWLEGSYRDGYGCTVYTPPSTIRVSSGSRPNVEETNFPFIDEL
jgi:hypothetical protein